MTSWTIAAFTHRGRVRPDNEDAIATRHDGSSLSDKQMSQPDAWRMIRRRANGGALEHAQEMAAHESPRTTKLYDRTKERLTQDEVERIRL